MNRLDSEVSLFWIDSDGKRTPYGSLKPGESRRQHTFAGHVWLVTRSGGAILAVFEAEEQPGQAVVDGREPAGRGPRGRRGGRGARPEAPAARPDTSSPDGKWEATVHGHNLFLRDTSTGKETPLTFNANPNSTYSRSEEADRAIEMNYETRDPASPRRKSSGRRIPQACGHAPEARHRRGASTWSNRRPKTNFSPSSTPIPT